MKQFLSIQSSWLTTVILTSLMLAGCGQQEPTQPEQISQEVRTVNSASEVLKEHEIAVTTNRSFVLGFFTKDGRITPELHTDEEVVIKVIESFNDKKNQFFGSWLGGIKVGLYDAIWPSPPPLHREGWKPLPDEAKIYIRVIESAIHELESPKFRQACAGILSEYSGGIRMNSAQMAKRTWIASPQYAKLKSWSEAARN